MSLLRSDGIRYQLWRDAAVTARYLVTVENLPNCVTVNANERGQVPDLLYMAMKKYPLVAK